MGSIDIIKPLSTVLSSTINKFHLIKYEEKNYWECLESNLELLGAKRDCYPLCCAAPNWLYCYFTWKLLHYFLTLPSCYYSFKIQVACGQLSHRLRVKHPLWYQEYWASARSTNWVPKFILIFSGTHQGLAGLAERNCGLDEEARGQGQGRPAAEGREDQFFEAGDRWPRENAGENVSFVELVEAGSARANGSLGCVIGPSLEPVFASENWSYAAKRKLSLDLEQPTLVWINSAQMMMLFIENRLVDLTWRLLMPYNACPVAIEWSKS